jgi:hypothetical protein
MFYGKDEQLLLFEDSIQTKKAPNLFSRNHPRLMMRADPGAGFFIFSVD